MYDLQYVILALLLALVEFCALCYVMNVIYYRTVLNFDTFIILSQMQEYAFKYSLLNMLVASERFIFRM
jgi:hypothetical protein